MNKSKFNITSIRYSLEKLFYTDIDQQTSACLFGSSITDDWVPGRSDLDLFVIVPETKLEIFGESIKKWHSNSAYPTLDGFILFSSSYGTMVKEFHRFDKSRPLGNFISPIDLWNIKNRSKYLFGQDVTNFIQDTSIDDLKNWALKDIRNHLIPHLSYITANSNLSPGDKLPLSALIQIASSVARMLMLTRGTICSSKRDALLWLSNEYIETKEIVNLLIIDFNKTDERANAFTPQQVFKFIGTSLQLLSTVKN